MAMEALDQQYFHEFKTGFSESWSQVTDIKRHLADADKWDGNERQTEIFGEVINLNWKK
jgi:hypothetical protein